MNLRLIAVFAAVLHMTATPSFPHHSFAAEFDLKLPVTLTGTVTKLEWASPHVWFYIDVKDNAGTLTNWGLEMAAPNSLLRAGWTRNSMKAGDLVTVDGFKARNGSNNANVSSVVLTATGQRLFSGSNPGL